MTQSVYALAKHNHWRMPSTKNTVCLIPSTEILATEFSIQLELTDTAQFFVSHAHQYQFLDTISALQNYLERNQDKSSTDSDPYIFFDIFCINQHRTSWSYEFLSNTFMSSIQQFGHTIVVMSPWNDPLPFTRAWCIYEAYCTSVTNSSYDIALSNTERDNFIKAIKKTLRN